MSHTHTLSFNLRQHVYIYVYEALYSHIFKRCELYSYKLISLPSLSARKCICVRRHWQTNDGEQDDSKVGQIEPKKSQEKIKMNLMKWITAKSDGQSQSKNKKDREKKRNANQFPHWGTKESKITRKAFQLKWPSSHRQNLSQGVWRKQKKKKKSATKINRFCRPKPLHYSVSFLRQRSWFRTHFVFYFAHSFEHLLVYSFIMNGMTHEENDLIHLNRILLPLVTLFLMEFFFHSSRRHLFLLLFSSFLSWHHTPKALSFNAACGRSWFCSFIMWIVKVSPFFFRIYIAFEFRPSVITENNDNKGKHATHFRRGCDIFLLFPIYLLLLTSLPLSPSLSLCLSMWIFMRRKEKSLIQNKYLKGDYVISFNDLYKAVQLWPDLITKMAK